MNNNDINRVIDVIISNPHPDYTREYAQELLRSCGILDDNNEIVPIYRDIITENKSRCHKEVRSLVRNIDDEIDTLLKIKEEVVRVNFIKGLDIRAEFISACKYDQLRSNQLLDNDTIYYIVDPEVGQYIEGYIE